MTPEIHEIETTCLTPNAVFTASGHVDRFTDVMSEDPMTGEKLRLDKYVESVLEAIDPKTPELKQLLVDVGSMTMEQLKQVVTEYQIKAPSGEPLSNPYPVNLMFPTTIGADASGYLRPELAQGIFMNFKRLLDTHTAKEIPFGIASVGQAFRNEIAPRNGLLRVREFTLAEIEYFVDPQNKRHHLFNTISNTIIQAWSREAQATGQPPTARSVGELVAERIIDNETLAYFIAKTQLFLNNIGLHHIRFRQHQETEMAHYAQDCWDAECLTSYSWIECVGIADRSAYDLTCHMKSSTHKLYAYRDIEPRTVTKTKLVPNKKIIGSTFLAGTNDVLKQLASGVFTDFQGIPITPEMYTFITVQKTITREKYIPNVIEPSYGIGRILYASLEQNFWLREDGIRAVISLPPVIVYREVAVVSLVTNEIFDTRIQLICERLRTHKLTYYTDSSKVSIGKKYARMDELGIPFCLTCDFESDHEITIRERDSMRQIRVPEFNVYELLFDLCMGRRSFESLI